MPVTVVFVNDQGPPLTLRPRPKPLEEGEEPTETLSPAVGDAPDSISALAFAEDEPAGPPHRRTRGTRRPAVRRRVSGAPRPAQRRAARTTRRPS